MWPPVGCHRPHVPPHPLQDVYERSFLRHVLSLPVVDSSDVLYQRKPQLKEVQLPYRSKKEFSFVANKLKIMFDFRVGHMTLT